MKNSLKYSKENFIRLIKETADELSSTKESSIEYLTNEGINVDELIKNSLNHIKRIRLKISANQTQEEMDSTNLIKDKAIAMVKKLLSDSNFNFSDFVKSENLALQNRNIEEFTSQDIESTLTNYFYLKFLEQEKKHD